MTDEEGSCPACGYVQPERVDSKWPANHGTGWTSTLDRKLMSWYSHGYSIAQVAKEFERTEYSIECRLHKLGLLDRKPKVWTTMSDSWLQRNASRTPVKTLAIELNCSEACVRDRLKLYGLKECIPDAPVEERLKALEEKVKKLETARLQQKIYMHAMNYGGSPVDIEKAIEQARKEQLTKELKELMEKRKAWCRQLGFDHRLHTVELLRRLRGREGMNYYADALRVFLRKRQELLRAGAQKTLDDKGSEVGYND